ncbi:hypothetical protein OAA60_04480 [Porticoccaceae bacterium]|nr:hypothetical protein [bacterium]MDB4277697.1 hypothetical protein [Gammaproteobacteria bacterium]MDB4352667.1 hypothetical protein [Porticoccaceae bacterium]
MNLLSVLLGGLIVLSILGIIQLVSHITKRITLEKRLDVEIESLSDWCEDISDELTQLDSRLVNIFSREIERLENLITVNRQNVERNVELELNELHHRVDICENKKCNKKGGCKPGGCKNCQDTEK